MAKIRAGTSPVSGLYYGDRRAVKAYLGDWQVWPDGPDPEPEPAGEETILTLELTSTLAQTLYFTQSVANGVFIDWGDGSPAETAAALSAAASHTYGAAGTYQVRMTAGAGVTWSPGAYTSITYEGNTFEDNVGICGTDAGGKTGTSPQLIAVFFGRGAEISRPFAFTGCTSLPAIQLPAGTTALPQGCFDGCTALSAVSGLADLTSIGSNCFSGCTALRSISLPDTVTTIAPYAFQQSGLTAFSFPAACTAIQEHVLRQCHDLASVTIPEGVTSIGQQAFFACSDLTSLTLPASLTDIYDPDEATAFTGMALCFCGPSSSLQNIFVAADNPTYSDADGVLCNKSGDMLLVFPAGRTGAYSIPPAMCVYNAAFAYSQLTRLTVPDGVTFATRREGTVIRLTPSATFTNTQLARLRFFRYADFTQAEVGCEALYGNAFEDTYSLAAVWIRSSCTTVKTNGTRGYGPFLNTSSGCRLYLEAAAAPGGFETYWDLYDANTSHVLPKTYGQTTSPFA